MILEQLEAAGLVEPRLRRGRGVPSPASLSPKGEDVLGEAFARIAGLDNATRGHLGEDYATLMRIVGVLEGLTAD